MKANLTIINQDLEKTPRIVFMEIVYSFTKKKCITT
jgi:hypothetical protein